MRIERYDRNDGVVTIRAHRPEDFGIGRLFEHIKDAVVVADTGHAGMWTAGMLDAP